MIYYANNCKNLDKFRGKIFIVNVRDYDKIPKNATIYKDLQIEEDSMLDDWCDYLEETYNILSHNCRARDFDKYKNGDKDCVIVEENSTKLTAILNWLDVDGVKYKLKKNATIDNVRYKLIPIKNKEE